MSFKRLLKFLVRGTLESKTRVRSAEGYGECSYTTDDGYKITCNMSVDPEIEEKEEEEYGYCFINGKTYRKKIK